MDLVRDTDTIVNQYLENNCFAGQNEKDTVKRYLKYRPELFFIEVDVFADKKVYHEQMQNAGARFVPLVINSKHIKSIYGIVQKTLFCLPDTRRIFAIFEEYINKLNKISLLYPKLDEADEVLAANYMVHSFAFFYRNHIEKNYYKLDFRPIRTEESWNLKSHFSEYQINIPEDQIENKTLQKIKDTAKFIELIKQQYNFFGYTQSIFDYVKFDTYTEKQFADYAEAIIRQANPDEKPFWVRNERQIYFDYGSHRYYPDFIMFYKGIFYVVETKGEIFSDIRKNLLLARLKEHKGYQGVLLYSDVLKEIDGTVPDISIFLKMAEDAVARYQSKSKLEKSPSEDKKFISYIPAYQPHKAYKKFIKNQKTNIDGWLKVSEIYGNYPKTCFAVQIKNQALFPMYKHNDWIILNTDFELSDCQNKIVLIQHEDINDDYQNNLTMRKLEITSKQIKRGLFQETENTLILSSLSGEEDIILENIRDNNVNIIGVIFKPELSMQKDIFRYIEPTKATAWKTCIPLAKLETAAGQFSKEQHIEEYGEWSETWVSWENAPQFEYGMFIAKVVGKSMEPKIPDGSYCLFRQTAAGSRRGKIVLVWHSGMIDSETSGEYTVKKYDSEKVHNEDTGWQHSRITLKPMNPKYDPIIIEPNEENEVRILAEFDSVVFSPKSAD